MAYEDKHGITQIRNDKHDNLSISRDTDVDEDDKEFPVAVFLYTPDMDNTVNHEHITMTVTEAEVLRDWLDQFIKEHKK